MAVLSSTSDGGSEAVEVEVELLPPDGDRGPIDAEGCTTERRVQDRERPAERVKTKHATTPILESGQSSVARASRGVGRPATAT